MVCKASNGQPGPNGHRWLWGFRLLASTLRSIGCGLFPLELINPARVNDVTRSKAKASAEAFQLRPSFKFFVHSGLNIPPVLLNLLYCQRVVVSFDDNSPGLIGANFETTISSGPTYGRSGGSMASSQ